jgi:ABC-type transport system involved in multi-copper enzyme maturation permease subunit
MSLKLLFKDELKGFYKSNVMIFLWIGLPLVVTLFHILTPSTGDIPFSTLTALIVSTLGGTLAAIMLAVSIVNEKEEHVYTLFVIRPIKRRDLILSKFFAVYTCLAIATVLALMLGLTLDYFLGSLPPESMLSDIFFEFALALSMIAVSSAVGVFIGVVSPTVLVGVILVLYIGNQLSALPMMSISMELSIPPILPQVLGVFGLSTPSMFSWICEIPGSIRFTFVVGLVLAMTLLAASIAIFQKKEL